MSSAARERDGTEYQRAMLDVAIAARAFLKVHGPIEEWENAYEEAEDLETALQEFEELRRG